MEITSAVKPTGNQLEIDVVNLWPNRLIGDAGLPAARQSRDEEKRLTKTNVQKFKKDTPLMPSGLLGPGCFEGVRIGPTNPPYRN